ncbi:MAG: glucosaminidase domain-containing protein [Myxococcaceae bacterium]
MTRTLSLASAVVVSLFQMACGGEPVEGDAIEASDTLEEVEAEATTWACYSPKPGHPTTAEKTAWIEQARGAAQDAEATYGVPAAAILAMTAVEAGYGWTRTALEANNPFGWKWTNSTAAGGRGYYVLGCQPSWDANNKYVRFSSVRDAIMFVSSKLASSNSSWANYKPVTDRYMQDRRNGVAVTTAVNRWIDGIADAGYNYDPPTYKPKLKKFANNYLSPSTTYSSTYNLYQYSASVGSGSGTGGGSGGGTVWISIDSPMPNEFVWGTVPLQSSVGGGTVTSVKYFTRAVGATSWYAFATDSSAPYGVGWATDPWVPNGAYEIKAEAWNGSTKVATGIIRVTVDNE